MADDYYNGPVNKYLQTYTTFSGADIVATFGGVEIGALSGITFSVTREKAPIYTMGSPNPRSFSRGTRGLAGSSIPGDPGHKRGISTVDSTVRDVVSKTPFYADQIPPFDITITFVNEYGQAAARSIYGCELLNEGSGASMDDIVIEETMTYVAREIGPMYRIATDQLHRMNTEDLNSIISRDAVSSSALNSEIIRP